MRDGTALDVALWPATRISVSTVSGSVLQTSGMRATFEPGHSDEDVRVSVSGRRVHDAAPPPSPRSRNEEVVRDWLRVIGGAVTLGYLVYRVWWVQRRETRPDFVDYALARRF